MKKQELETVVKELKEIKDLTDRQEYVVSSYANQRFINIFPILDKELKRLSTEKIEVNCPALLLISVEEANKSKQTVTDYINKKLQELVLQEYKIIDYGIYNENLLYIKYTS